MRLLGHAPVSACCRVTATSHHSDDLHTLKPCFIYVRVSANTCVTRQTRREAGTQSLRPRARQLEIAGLPAGHSPRELVVVLLFGELGVQAFGLLVKEDNLARQAACSGLVTAGGFLLCALMVVTAAGCGAGSDPSTPDDGSAAASSSAAASGAAITTLGLTPSQTNSSGPWTFGQPIKDGDLAAGAYIACSNTSACQADIRNHWPDGSAKFAVLSGISNFTKGTPLTVALTGSTTAPSCPNGTVPEPPNTSLPNAYVTFTAISGDSFSISSGGTYYIDSVLGTAQGPWSTATGGRVRSIAGCVMSEFHYYQPTSDPNLSLWWYVRAYTNGSGGIGAVEIEVAVENGWFNASNPSQKDYGVSVYLGGTAPQVARRFTRLTTSGGASLASLSTVRVSSITHLIQVRGL